jgi:hypothetical protein
MEMGGQLHAPTALSPGKEPPVKLDTRLGGPQSRSGRCGEKRILATNPKFAWKDLEIPLQVSVRFIGVPDEIKTGHLPNISQKPYHLSQLARSVNLERSPQIL